eukprot:TRINITY_DN18237_c0_g1_i1.p2 TRINITY_DN18237_c0_g1~~TRINITY_DN18237_c0_g1_i1.p2  ORF type:complete len:232 (+),score=70.19 TRINITY_DN18237_c0_g1_i1:50-745(+)
MADENAAPDDAECGVPGEAVAVGMGGEEPREPTRKELLVKIDQLRYQRNQAYEYVEKMRRRTEPSEQEQYIAELEGQVESYKAQLQRQHDSSTAKIAKLNEKILTLRETSQNAEADRRAAEEAETVIECLRQAVQARVSERDQALLQLDRSGSGSISHSPLSSPRGGGGSPRVTPRQSLTGLEFSPPPSMVDLATRVEDLEEQVETLRSQRDIARSWIAERQKEDALKAAS